MYEEFFEMEQNPFTKAIPENSLYESANFRETLGRLKYVADRQMFAVLTGDSGCGKSTLIRRFCANLPKDEYLVMYLSDSQLTPRWLYTHLLEQLGVTPRFYRGDAKRQLQKELEIIRSVNHKKVVIVLDEAHLLDRDTLEEFRFLLNCNFDSENPMSLVLVGQTELCDVKLKMQSYTAIRQRVEMYCVLRHLDRAETEAYIRTLLRYSGQERDIFTDEAIENVYRLSAGVPRMINRICDMSLMYAFQQQKRLVDDHMVNYVSEHEILMPAR